MKTCSWYHLQSVRHIFMFTFGSQSQWVPRLSDKIGYFTTARSVLSQWTPDLKSMLWEGRNTVKNMLTARGVEGGWVINVFFSQLQQTLSYCELKSQLHTLLFYTYSLRCVSPKNILMLILSITSKKPKPITVWKHLASDAFEPTCIILKHIISSKIHLIWMICII